MGPQRITSWIGLAAHSMYTIICSVTKELHRNCPPEHKASPSRLPGGPRPARRLQGLACEGTLARPSWLDAPAWDYHPMPSQDLLQANDGAYFPWGLLITDKVGAHSLCRPSTSSQTRSMQQRRPMNVRGNNKHYDPHHRLGQALFTTSMGLDKRYAED